MKNKELSAKVEQYMKKKYRFEIVEDEDEENPEPGLFDEGDDPLYQKALDIVIEAGKASASYIQRRLKIGYNRAGRIMDQLEAAGIVGPAEGSKPRKVYIDSEYALEQFIQNLDRSL